MEEIDKNEIYRKKDSLQILLNSKIKKYFYKLPLKMKTLFRKKPEMCLFQSVKYIYILLLKIISKNWIFSQ
jgi:hypothetical protein